MLAGPGGHVKRITQAARQQGEAPEKTQQKR